MIILNNFTISASNGNLGCNLYGVAVLIKTLVEINLLKGDWNEIKIDQYHWPNADSH